MVWECTAKCRETLLPLDSKTLFAGSVPHGSPQCDLSLEEQASLLLTMISKGWMEQVLDTNH